MIPLVGCWSKKRGLLVTLSGASESEFSNSFASGSNWKSSLTSGRWCESDKDPGCALAIVPGNFGSTNTQTPTPWTNLDWNESN